MVGLSGKGSAAQNVVDLGEEGLQDGDDISPYIDRHWTDGTEVRIPAGSYRYDGSGLNGSRGDCSLIGSEDGVEFQRDSSKIRPTIRCTHGTMRVENINVRGQTPSSENTEGDRWRFEALDPDSVVEVVNVNHPDGSADNSDSNAFMTYDDHRGTLHFKNCYTMGFGNSTYYTNLGYRSGETNPVIIENCTIVDANGAIRGGHNGSQYVDCTFVWRNEPPSWVSGSAVARGIRWDHNGHDNLVENCHFYFGSDTGSTGESLDVADQGADTSGVVRDVYIHTESDGAGGITDASGGNWSFQNVHVSGSGSPNMDCGVAGSQAPDLRNEDVVWMPESQTVRPGGATRSDGSTADGTAEDESMFEVVSTDSDAELQYAFDVDGSARKAEASDDNTSVGESNDTVDPNGDGTVTVEGTTGMGKGDAFHVGGDVTSFERTGGNSGFRLLLDGDDVTDQLAPDGGDQTDEEDEEDATMFEIVSTDDDAEFDYAFTVEGGAERAEVDGDVTSVGENNDAIADNGDGTVTVEGHTGLGKGDAYRVDGDVTAFERTGGESGFELRLDGEDVTDELADGDGGSGGDSGPKRVYVDGTAAPEEVNEYRIEVSGEIQPDPENTHLVDGGLAWDALTDVVDGSTAVGIVGNGVDAYTFTGEVVDLTVECNATAEVED